MGIFDEIKDKATELIHGHHDKVDDAVEKAGDMVDEKTEGKFSDKVDTAQEKAKEVAEKLDPQS
jgi:hypothetical protein